MCKSKSEGGVRCLSHMSQQISKEFGDAYKALNMSKKGVLSAGGPTTAFSEALTECAKAIDAADDLTPQARKAAHLAVSATAADYLASAHKKQYLATGQPLPPDFADKREKLRTARTSAQKHLHDMLPKKTEAGSAHETEPVLPTVKPHSKKASVHTPSLPTTWNPPAGYASVKGLHAFKGVEVTPGATHVFDAGAGRTVTVKDRRSGDAPAMVVNEETMARIFDVVGIGPGKVEIRIKNEPGVYGTHSTRSDGTHVITVNIKDKDEYPVGAGYVINNSLVHELRHAHQAQVTPNFNSAYAAETAANGYNGNKFEVDAWAFGRLADHTGTKTDLPEGMTAMAGEVWAILPKNAA